MSDNLNFLALEPRIMFDGAMAGDVADQTSDTTDQPDHTPEPAPSDKKQVVLISNAVADNEDLANAVKDGVIAITYDADASLDSILDSLKAALGDAQADSIALASHNGLLDGSFYINDTLVTLNRLTADEAVQNFFKEIGTLIKPDGRLDILACDFAGSEQGTKAHGLITDLVGRTVTASDDETGNEASGGDWFMELGEIDASSYFDQDRLQDFDGTLIQDTAALVDFLVQDDRITDININNVVSFYDGYGLAFSATILGDEGSTAAIVLTDGSQDGLFFLSHPDWTAETTIQYLSVSDQYIYVISQTGENVQFAFVDVEAFGQEIQAVDLTNPETGHSPSQISMLFSEDGGVALNTVINGTRTLVIVDLTNGEILHLPNEMYGEEVVSAHWSENTSSGTFYASSNDDGIMIKRSDSDAIIVGEGNGPSHGLVATETKVFFLFGTDQLWVTDGTEAGTHEVVSLDVEADDPPVKMQAFGDKVIFTARNYGGSHDVFVSDGTNLGTRPLMDVLDGSLKQSLDVKIFGDYLYFTGARTVSFGVGIRTVYDLWRTDGTPDGTTLVSELNARTPVDLSKGVIHQDKLYFTADNDGLGTELFVSDGTADGTRVLLEIPGYNEGFTGQLMLVNGEILAEVKTSPDSPSALYRLDMIYNSAPTVDVNDMPVLTIDPVGSGQEGIVQTAVAPIGVLEDFDGDTEWNGGTLVLEVVSGTEWETLELTQGVDSTVTMDTDGHLYYNSTLIGMAEKVANSATAGASISFTFNENATNAIVQTVLQHVDYALDVEGELSGSKTVRITATDKDGGTTTFDRTLLINERPAITVVASPPPVYSVGGDPVSFSNISAITDTSNVTLKFQITENSEATDTLSFTGTTDFYIDGNYLYRDGSNIAHVNQSTGSVASGSELVFTFNQNATAEDMANVSKAITFSSSAAAPSADTRTITTTAVDYFGAESSVTNVVAINEAPKVETTQTDAVVYVLGGDPIKLADITGITEDKLNGATLSFQITGNAEASDILALDLDGTYLFFQNGNIVLTGTTFATLNVTTDSVTGSRVMTFTFTEDATTDIVKTIWNSMTYSSSSDSMGVNDRTLTATVVDSEGAKTVLTRTIDINEAPKVSSTDSTIPLYHAGETAVDLVNNLTITEDAVDGAKLKFFVAGNAESTDVLAFTATTPYRVDGTNLYNGTTLIGTINVDDAKVTFNNELAFTFNQDATITDIQNVWKSIEFSSTATEPSTEMRQIRATVVDAHGAESSKTHFMNVNLPPEIEAVTKTGQTYTLGNDPIVLDQTITLSDADGWENASIRFQVSEETADFTTLKLDPSLVPNLIIEDGALYLSNVWIGQIIGGGDGVAEEGAELVISFTQDTTDEAAQAIYRSIVFSYGGQDVPAAPHDIAVRVTDNAGHITDLTYSVTVVEPVQVSSSTEPVKTVGSNEGDVNPVSVIQDPVHEGQQDGDDTQTFVNPNAQGTLLGTDGSRTFLGGNSGLGLGTDGQRTIIRADNAASGTGQGTGAGWGAFSGAGNGVAGGLGGQVGGVGEASFNDAGAPDGDTFGEDLLDNIPQQAPAGDQQAALEGFTPARDSFAQQLAKRGRSGAFGTAELLTAANDQLLKVQGA